LEHVSRYIANAGLAITYTGLVHHFFDGIAEMDLVQIQEKTRRQMGWTAEEADAAVLRYRRFLALAGARIGIPLVPTKAIDAVWHNHILDTEKYARDMHEYLGRFLHHRPTYGQGGGSAKNNFVATQRAYEAVFAEPYVAADADCMGSCGSGEAKQRMDKCCANR